LSDPSPVTRAAATRPLFPLTRRLSPPLTRVLARMPLTPNQITGLSLLAGLAGDACFLTGGWGWAIAGGLLLVLCYTLDNCDGEIARLKGMSSAWGAKFDDLADWLVDAAFFTALGYGTWVATGNVLWFWLGAAAAAGATIDYVVDLVIHARDRKAQDKPTREEVATEPRKPEDMSDWLIYIFHKLSRADFCVIVLALALIDSVWVLLPLAAVGAQAYWITDLFKRARGWHT
jgi:hypothetical protein